MPKIRRKKSPLRYVWNFIVRRRELFASREHSMIGARRRRGCARPEQDGGSRSYPCRRGRTSNQYVVDGKWINDPRAVKSTPNAFGGRNSVLVVETK